MPIDVDVSLEAAPSVLYDAVVLPERGRRGPSLRADGRALEFLKDQYRHCKPLLALGEGRLSCCTPVASARCCRPASPIRGSSSRWRTGQTPSTGSSRRSPSTGISNAKRIPRAYESPTTVRT